MNNNGRDTIAPKKSVAIRKAFTEPVHLNIIQAFLTVATGIMLITTIAIVNIVVHSQIGIASVLNVVLQLLAICAIFFACILLSKIEEKTNWRKKI